MHPSRLLASCLGLALSLSFALAQGKVKSQPGDPVKGKAVFAQCAVCHNADSTEKKMGPGLKGLFHKPKLVSGKKVTEETVLARINAGGNGMPAYKDMLTDAERNDLMAFLKTL
jgi:cytochrome c